MPIKKGGIPHRNWVIHSMGCRVQVQATGRGCRTGRVVHRRKAASEGAADSPDDTRPVPGGVPQVGQGAHWEHADCEILMVATDGQLPYLKG